jgi:hypothetical protein
MSEYFLARLRSGYSNRIISTHFLEDFMNLLFPPGVVVPDQKTQI